MTDAVTINNITPPRVALVDEQGLITRQWFMWFLNMFSRANLTDADIKDLFDQVAGIAVSPRPPEFVLPDYVGPAPFVQPPPSLGGLMTLLISAATVSQQLTNTESTIAFDTNNPGAFGPVTRVGNTFVVNVRGTYVFIFEPQVRQDKNNNITTFWVNVNGTAVPGSGAVYVASAINDSNVVSLTFSGTLQVGDVITFRAITSLSNGSTLLFAAAAPPAPAVTAVQVIIVGYQT